METRREKPTGSSLEKMMDVVEKDLEDLGVQDWREIMKDRDLVMAAKTLGELGKPEKEEEEATHF